MPDVVSVVLCAVFSSAAVMNAAVQKNGTMLLKKAAALVHFVRTEIRYSGSTCDEIVRKARLNGFALLFGNGNMPELPDSAGSNAVDTFSEFWRMLGTTDRDGQIELCDEYSRRMAEILEERRKNEKEKVRVVAAVCVFCAVAVLVL